MRELIKNALVSVPGGRRDICKNFGKALERFFIRTKFLQYLYLALLLRLTGFPQVLPGKFHVFLTLPG